MNEIHEQPAVIPITKPAESCPIGPAGQGSECGTSLWKPPKFDLRFLFLVVSLAAIWFALLQFQNSGSMTVISVIMLTWLFGCPRTRNAVLAVVPAMYLPFAWLPGCKFPFSQFSRSWLETWGAMPGLEISVILFPGFFPEFFTLRLSDSPTFFGFLPATITFIIFFGAVLAIRFGKYSKWWIAIPLFALCIAFSWMSYRHYCGVEIDYSTF